MFLFEKIVLLKQYDHTYNSCIDTYKNGVDNNVPVQNNRQQWRRHKYCINTANKIVTFYYHEHDFS